MSSIRHSLQPTVSLAIFISMFAASIGRLTMAKSFPPLFGFVAMDTDMSLASTLFSPKSLDSVSRISTKGAWGCPMTTWGIAADMDTMSSLLSSSCTMQASLRQRSSSTSCLRARSSLTSCVSAAIWALIRFRSSSRVGWVEGAIVVEAFGKSEHFTHYEFLVMTAINGTININHQLRQTHNQQLHYGKQPAQQSSIAHISRARCGRPTEHLTSAIDTNTQRTQKKTSVSHQSKIQTPVIGISRKPKGCLTKSMQVIDLFTLIGNNGELHGGQNTGCDRCHFGQPTLTAEIGPWLRDLPAGDREYR
jgi:hypothetical protein